MKLNKIKYLAISTFILNTIYSYSSNKEVLAVSESNLFYKSVVENLDGNGRDYLNSITKTKDEGYIVVGRTDSTNLGFENAGNTGKGIIVKYDRDGKKEWINSIGSSEDILPRGRTEFNKVIETKKGDFIAVGIYYGSNPEFINNGEGDAIIVKYDNKGNQVWVKNWGGSKDDKFLSLIELKNEDIMVVGNTSSSDTEFGYQNGTHSGIIIQYDKNGNKLNGDCIGDVRITSFNEVVELDDGDVMVMGHTNSRLGFEIDNSYLKQILLRYNNNCEKKWIKAYDNGSQEFPEAMIKTSKGEFFTVACNNKYNYSRISKYDENGVQIWTKNFGDHYSNHSFKSIYELKNGNILVVGSTNRSGFGVEIEEGINTNIGILVEYDTNGNIIKINTYSDARYKSLTSIVVNEDEDIIMLCETEFSDFKTNIVRYNVKYNDYFDKVKNAEDNREILSFNEARDFINSMEENVFKRYLQNKLNDLRILESLELKTASANLDIYIKSENMLLLSLDTNSVTFEDFSGVEDMVKTDAVNITINSSLPYQLNAYLPAEIQNADKTNSMDKSILNIKENSETDYKEFANINEKVVLKDNCPSGNDLIHGIDIKLKGGIAHEKDVYKTTIKLEAEQK